MSAVTETRAFIPELPKLNELLVAVDRIAQLNPSDGAGYELRKLRGYRNALFERFAPFKVGDRVVLHTAVDISLGSGWQGRQEMMQPGATGEVRVMDWHQRRSGAPGEGCFVATVKFDNEWYVYRGERFDADPDERHVFMFGNPEQYWEVCE